MAFYDLTVPISGDLPVWPGDPRVIVEPTSRISRGDTTNMTRLDMGSHTGTHIDAPLHFEPDGSTVDRLPLDVLIGRARLVELDVKEKIARRDLEALDLSGVTRLLFRTANTLLWRLPASGRSTFRKDYIYVAPDAADYIVEHGIRLVGVDYLSVEKYGGPDHATHHRLLRAGVVVLEGIDPHGVPPGDYDLIALPLRVEGCDGAPTRVILQTISA